MGLVLVTFHDPKILVAIPTYEGKDYIFKENWEAVKNLNYKNYDYVYIDNSVTPDYYFKLKRRGAPVVRVPRAGNSRQALCNAQNWARNKVLTENYDYLMFIESDLLPDREILNRLLGHISYGKPVIGSLYMLESTFKEASIPVERFESLKKVLAASGNEEPKGIVSSDGLVDIHDYRIRIPCIFFINPPNATRLIKLNEVPNFVNTGLRRVHGTGLGATLIHRRIVEKYMFWYEENIVNKDKHSDVYFYMELHNDGIPVYVDTDVLIGHRPSKWSDVKDR